MKKEIPIGAGLGGGSSNAASALLALNNLWGLEISQTDLLKLGKDLGADVPFFLNGKNAYVSGIGDKLKEKKSDNSYYILIYILKYFEAFFILFIVGLVLICFCLCLAALRCPILINK